MKAKYVIKLEISTESGTEAYRVISTQPWHRDEGSASAALAFLDRLLKLNEGDSLTIWQRQNTAAGQWEHVDGLDC